MCAEWVKCADKEHHSTSYTNNNNSSSSSSNNWQKTLLLYTVCPNLLIALKRLYAYTCWYCKRAIFWYTYCFIHIFGGAVNKHIQSIGTRVRDFMVRFYRLKLVLQCIHNDVICCCCCYCRLLLFPLWVIRHVGCSVALCVLGSMCACHYRMKIESIFLIYCSCSCMHSFFCFRFSLYLLFLFVASLLFFFCCFSICFHFFLLQRFSLNTFFSTDSSNWCW